MTKRFPIQSLLFLSISAVIAGCTVEVDEAGNSRPVIHLNGESTLELAANETYIEPGYQALDAEDGDITAHVLSNSSAINSQVPGEYEITYGVSDSGSLEALTAKRRVTVLAATEESGGNAGGDNTEDASGTDDAGSANDQTADDTIENSVVEALSVDVPSIASFQLLAFPLGSDKVVVNEITDGTSLDLSLMPTNLLNIEAVSSDVSETGSVRFVLDGPIALDRYENNAVYTMQTEPTQIDTDNGELPLGDYSLTVTPYSAPDMGGQKGVPRTVTFKVKDSRLETPVVDVPSISSFQLLAFTPESDKVVVNEITDGTSLDLSLMPTNLLNIEAVSADVSETGSVHFVLDGPLAVDRYENNAVYTMQTEPGQLNTDNGELPVGDYSLTVTPYSAADMGGHKGLSQTVTFKVKDSRLELSNVPKILAAEFVAVAEGKGDMNTFARIDEGYELDLSSVPVTHVNVLAISEDEAKTGSVHFSLNGPTTIDRYENEAVYTMAEEQTALDLTKDDLRNGDYTLIITPYADSDMGGEAGIPLMVNFSVTGTAQVDGSSVPEVTPPEEAVTLEVHPDSYRFNKGSDEQPGMTTAAGANDVFDAASAQFTVVSQPKHGTVTMFDLGFFEYTPAPDFAGTDSFTYQVSQNGQTATASANITVYDPQSKQGFTAIKPSADSKLIYVSSSEGSDSNTCLAPAMPCKSIGAALEKMRKGFPDHIYLKRGDVWRDQTISNVQSGRSSSEPAVLAFYGESGARPLLESENSLFVINNNRHAKKHLHIIGLHFYAYKLDPKNPSFTGSHNDGATLKIYTANEDFLFEDNVFDFLEIVLQGHGGDNPKDMTFRRNIWTGAYTDTSSYSQSSRPSNMYVNNVDGLVLEDNVLDRGGWNPEATGAAANMYNHNLYIQYDNVGNGVVLRNNIITRASSHGVHGRPGGLYENNFFARNAISLQMGYRGHPLSKGTKAQAYDNVITEGHSMIKGKDACRGTNLCTKAVWGLTVAEPGAGEITVKGNVVHSLSDAESLHNSGGFYDTFKNLTEVGINIPDSASHANNINWKWDNDGKATDGKSYPAAGRTLADYNAYLGGTTSFDAFMDVVLTRPLQTWDEKYSASAINNYVREGFNVTSK